LKQKNKTKNLSLYFFIISFGTFLGIYFTFGIDEFFLFFKEGFKALKDFVNPPASLWPNLYIEVSELRESSLERIIYMTGEYINFFIALLGFFACITKAVKRPKETNPLMTITVAIFLLCFIFITLGARRFALLCVIPLSILLAIGVQNIFDFIKNFTSKKLAATRHRKYIADATIILFSLFLLINLHINMYKRISTSLLDQIFNDTWKTTLERIKHETPPESIINTWWSPGHFIKAIAKRRVTFDGATINAPQAYWLANVFIARDEKKALGILRMINNSGNLETEYLLESGFKLSDAVDLLKKITPVNKQQARIILQSKLNNNKINELLKLTHKIPAPAYLLLREDSVDKIMQLVSFGKWNFKKIEEINKDPAKRAKYLTSGRKNYLDTMLRLSGGLPRYHAPFPALARSGSKIFFDWNIVIDTENMRASITSEKSVKGIPYSLFYLKNNNFMEKKFHNASLPYSMMLFSEFGLINCLLLDTDLAKSIMIRMYFFNAIGLKHIHPAIKEHSLSKRTQVHVYKVDWAGFLAEIGEEN
jgi:dolichyl-diphosphooligosaccharide--protein glycosyltransferase